MPKQTQGKKDVRTIPIQISVNLHASPQGEKAPRRSRMRLMQMAVSSALPTSTREGKRR